jgi:hypothetical protein
VFQIDIVPTLSAIFGVPIPFGNLGKIIPELFYPYPETYLNFEALGNFLEKPSEYLKFSRETMAANDILRKNCWQILNYLEKYSEIAGQFPEQEMNELREIFGAAEEKFSESFKFAESPESDDQKFSWLAQLSLETFRKFSEFHSRASELCRNLWTSFDTGSMDLGISFVSMCVAILGNMILSKFREEQKTETVSEKNSRKKSGRNWSDKLFTKISGVNFIAGFLVILRSLALTSNSFIEAEEKVLHFLHVTMALVYFWNCLEVICFGDIF